MTESVKNELSDICRIIDATVDTEKIYLFGSYAYGTLRLPKIEPCRFFGGGVLFYPESLGFARG